LARWKHISVWDDSTRYFFSASGQNLFPTVLQGEKNIWAAEDIDVQILDQLNSLLAIERKTLKLRQADEISAIVEITAHISDQRYPFVSIRLNFEIFQNGTMSISIALHNKTRAIHSNGLWDLGDSNSFLFNDFSVTFKRNGSDHISLHAEPLSDPVQFNSSESATLFQASSGGSNWNSDNHVNARGTNPIRFNGYSIERDGTLYKKGSRATPTLLVHSNAETNFALSPREFWQSFPSALSIASDQIRVGIFPSEHGDTYELQGGERKTHELFVLFSAQSNLPSHTENFITLVPEAAYIQKTAVFDNSSDRSYGPYDNLLKCSLDDTTGFINKRENQDEYGWRNYGEVVADHESLYEDTDYPLVSHYNNQYDPIFGFARQYFMTSDSRWWRLADELARHVLDIDIYRTEDDRVEYNNGLFWHTNHYLPAATSTHRTYSKTHYESNWKGELGGGPGPEHCYTSGLKYYYYMTGNVDARQTVLNLASWIRFYYEGTGTLLERIRKLILEDRYNLLSVLKKHKVFIYRYPLNRGVGNYLRALLDSYELTLDNDYLKEAESLILNTFGSTDDIESRDLDDVEYTWFYTIFIQEVIKYLDIKRVNKELDEQFVYARDALLHYAEWMSQNETPSLESKKPLFYANDTWIAQDIRKSNILYAAYRYQTNKRNHLLDKARFFRDYVLRNLNKSDTLHFSRIQIILLQNHGPAALMEMEHEPYSGMLDLPDNPLSQQNCFHTRRTYSQYLAKSCWKSLKTFSLKREIRWFKARLR